jgi:ABC-type glycerol-3-phosphate transport system permease component
MNLQQINALLRNPSWDVIVIFAFIAVGFFYGISSGRSKLLALLFSLYVSGFLFENFYYIGQLVKGRTIIEEFLFRSFIFATIAVILTILFSKVLGGPDSGPRNWWKSLLLSFVSAGLLFSYLFHLFPAREIFTFSPLIQNFFASESAFFWWLTLPLIAIFLARK